MLLGCPAGVLIVVKGGVQIRWPCCCFFTAEPGSAAPLGLPQHSRAFSDGCCRPGGLVGLVSFLLRVLFCSGLSLSFTCRVPVAIAVVPTPCCKECSLAPWRSVYIGSYSPGCSEDLWASPWWGPLWVEEAWQFPPSVCVPEVRSEYYCSGKKRDKLVKATDMKGFYISKPHLPTTFRSLL